VGEKGDGKMKILNFQERKNPFEGKVVFDEVFQKRVLGFGEKGGWVFRLDVLWLYYLY